eukprot:3228099-Rhodomonas_salina.1
MEGKEEYRGWKRCEIKWDTCATSIALLVHGVQRQWLSCVSLRSAERARGESRRKERERERRVSRLSVERERERETARERERERSRSRLGAERGGEEGGGGGLDLRAEAAKLGVVRLKAVAHQRQVHVRRVRAHVRDDLGADTSTSWDVARSMMPAMNKSVRQSVEDLGVLCTA